MNWRGIIFLLVGLVSVNLVKATGKVNIQVEANWSETHPLYEFAEYFLDEPKLKLGLEKYYQLLLKATSPPLPKSYKGWYDKIIRLLNSTETTDEPLNANEEQTSWFEFPSAELDLLKLMVSTHYYSPKIESLRHSLSNPPSCPNWIEFTSENGQIVQQCDLNQFEETFKATEHNLILFTNQDRIYQHKDSKDGINVLFYGNAAEKGFYEILSGLLKLRKEHKIKGFALRYYKTGTDSSPQISTALSGYGAELVIKNTEYIVLDDRKSKSAKDSDDSKVDEMSMLSGKNSLDKLFNLNSTSITAIEKEKIKLLGLKATSLIYNSEQPLKTLKELLQDFPRLGPSLALYDVPDDIAKKANQMKIHGFSKDSEAILVNGMVMHSSDVNLFRLLRLIRYEIGIYSFFKQMGSFGNEITKTRYLLEKLQKPLDETLSQETFHPMFDLLSDDILIIWFNDLENDKEYEEWHESISVILNFYPGQQFFPIRKNLVSSTFVYRMNDPNSVSSMKNDFLDLLDRKIPIRFSFVPIVDYTDPNPETSGLKISSWIYQAKNSYDIQGLRDFIDLMAEKVSTSADALNFTRTVEESVLPQFLKDMSLKQQKDYPDDDSLKIQLENFKESAAKLYPVRYLKDFSKRLRLTKNGVFVNGRLFPLDETYPQFMLDAYKTHTQYLQQQVYQGSINDETDIFDHFQGLPHVQSHRNPLIFPSLPTQIRRVLDLTEEAEFLKSVNSYKFEGKSIDEDQEIIINIPCVTIWVVADLNTSLGVRLAHDALDYSKNGENMRVALFDTSLTAEITPGENHTSRQDALELLQKVLKKELSIDEIRNDLRINSHISQVFQVTNTSQAYIILNGRVVGPIENASDFERGDFEVIVPHEMSTNYFPIQEYAGNVLKTYRDVSQRGDLMVRIYSAALGKAHKPISIGHPFQSPSPPARSTILKDLEGQLLNKESAKKTELIHIEWLLNPLSTQAQAWSPYLEIIESLSGVKVDLVLNPELELNELPVQSFYRGVLSKELEFFPDGTLKPRMASFEDLPSGLLLTLELKAISPWLITPVEAETDLDNILLKDNNDISATFELRNLLIEGHCIDLTNPKNRQPPRGLQLNLVGEADQTPMDATIVMANLGYYQLKATPGQWQLHLREGPSAVVYELITLEGTPVSANPVSVDSFEGEIVLTNVRKKPGKEDLDILQVEKGMLDTFWEQISSSKHADINVFSVASGHLYERFLSIMTVSVMRNTKKTVKFWFIENFISPNFKKFLPILAEKYSFKYELITYQWPHWLRAQSVKQRRIWGYKLLFLDVIFPLDLERVIFVDADQIVRADLYELVTMDLNGAPYGYTPFCDDRPEIDSYRFWKTGYWKNHLGGKPYHISALYVVDLLRFRKIAAGDLIRHHYQMLSADPNSLANLDQDLPNNIQPIVPIFSLPQEWLWCETWCSDETLTTAKTIDLCNNPMTKEPKLARAKRLLPEWEVYDEEIQKLQDQFLKDDEESSDEESSDDEEEEEEEESSNQGEKEEEQQKEKVQEVEVDKVTKKHEEL